MQIGATETNHGKLLEPGDMFGDYIVEKLLGKGGMGAVYLVRAPGGERYAVKVMFPDMVKKGSDYRKRFAREAEFAMKIRHRNLISVYDVGEDPETGLCYIIMDYVPGGSVADRLAANGALPMAEAVSIAAQVALALDVAHRHGVIHRDIKPDNILLDEDGTPKLADLGVAKFSDTGRKSIVTTTGLIIGTPAYMAPEQMMDSHNVDARADIYALGLVLYEMLTGKRLNEGKTAVELITKAIKDEPLPDVKAIRPEVSTAIAQVLSLMCASKPERRPATALEAAQLLKKAASGRLKFPKKTTRAVTAKQRKLPLPVAACVICALIICAVAFGWRIWSSQQKTPADSVTMTDMSDVDVVSDVAIRPIGERGVSPAASKPSKPLSKDPTHAQPPSKTLAAPRNAWERLREVTTKKIDSIFSSPVQIDNTELGKHSNEKQQSDVSSATKPKREEKTTQPEDSLCVPNVPSTPNAIGAQSALGAPNALKEAIDCFQKIYKELDNWNFPDEQPDSKKGGTIEDGLQASNPENRLESRRKVLRRGAIENGLRATNSTHRLYAPTRGKKNILP